MADNKPPNPESTEPKKTAPAADDQHNWSDREITREADDSFSTKDYAKVLANRATNTDTPLTIGIFGRWGSGKTSLMQLTRAALKAQAAQTGAPLHTIWINVWQLSTQDEVWHAFLQALFSQVHRQLPRWRRIDYPKLLRQLFSNSYRVVVAITPLVLGLLISKPDAGWADVGSLVAAGPAAGFGALLTVGLSLWVLVKPIIEKAHETVNFDLEAVLKDVPYEAQITELMRLQGQFEDMVKMWVGDKGRLVVFIDDLDRCTPDKVPEVLEAIKLFTATSRCVYILGLDHDIVRQGIETKYKFDDEAAAEYLEKVVQIPFHLPPLDEGRIERFVDDYYPELHQECPTAPDVFAQGLEPNPRKVKRAMNIYRTLLELAQVRVNAWEMDPVDPELVAKMVVIQNRFRKLYDHLVEHPTTLIQLEQAALEGDAAEKKRKLSTETYVEERDQPALDAMLKAGKVHFKELPEGELSAYIYLTGTAEGTADQFRPSRREREALLGGERADIEAEVNTILSRGADEAGRQRIGTIYIERLETVLDDSDSTRYTAEERASAEIALVLFEVFLLGDTPDTIQARLDKLLYVESEPAQAMQKMAAQTKMDDKTSQPRQESQAAKERLNHRLELALDDVNSYNSTQITTVNIARDLMMGWERQEFEPQTVIVPAGSFLMGSDPAKDKDAQDDEQPQHEVHLSAYRIGKYPVTNAEYQVFVLGRLQEPPEHWDGDTYPEGKADHPVVNISWPDAVAYCRWLSKESGQTYRLPTEAEWEKAARGPSTGSGQAAAGRIYAWGNKWDPAKLNSREDGPGDTTPVGHYSPQGDSPYGAADMCGNVWEWNSTIWEEKAYPFKVEDEWTEDYLNRTDVRRVLRGGSWHHSPHKTAAVPTATGTTLTFGTLATVFGCWFPPFEFLIPEFLEF